MTPAAEILSRHWPEPYTYPQLLERAATPWPGLLRSVESQSVTRMYDVVMDALGQRSKVVLFGVDAVPWRVLVRHQQMFSRLIPATSVVPTSSASVWSSVLRGRPPHQHGVHGVVMYDRAAEASVSVLSNTVFDPAGGQDRTLPELDLFLDGGAGIFRDAALRYGTQGHMFGLLALTREATIARALADGARWRVGDRYQELLDEPMELFQLYQGWVREALAEPSESAFVFCFLDLDTYLHEHAFTDPLLERFFVALNAFARDITEDMGACCFMVSDHGMVQQPRHPGTISLGRDRWIWERSYARPGGAGRVQFFYPRPDEVENVRSRLVELMGGTGVVLDRERYVAELAAPGVARVHGVERIGELVTVATEPAFPSVMCASLQEHGSLTEDEMMVAMAALG